ncbi:MAG TPA: hypothetical protein PLN52_24050 [Opitutaceae bacterium]|nr:hypothetical protein [Opitutaceae bacterium]
MHTQDPLPDTNEATSPRGPFSTGSARLAALHSRFRTWLSRSSQRTGLSAYSLRVRHRENLGKLQAQLARLPEHQSQLSSTMNEGGRRFSGIGDLLEKMTTSGSQLVSEGQRLLVLASGKNEGETVLESAIDLLHEPLGYMQTCATDFENLLGALETCERQLHAILGLQSSLERTIAPLGYVQTLYKIESANLAPELAQMFIAVSHDIHRLQDKVAGMFRERFTQLKSMHVTLLQIMNDLRTVLPQLHRLGNERRRDIDLTLTELQDELKKNETRDLRLSSATRAISNEIGQVVVGLQFHDIITQKTHHLNQSLTESGSLGAHVGRESPTQLTDSLRRLEQGNRLQAAHLKAIRQDLNEAMSTIASSIQKTITHTHELDENCVALTELNKVTVAPDGMIQVLLDTIGEIKDIVGSTLKKSEQIHHQLAPIDNTAHSLTSTMTDLSVTMHLIALNAQIQAIRMGEGTGLEILAARTVEISFATTTFSNEALEKLNAVADAITQVTRGFSKLHQEGQSQQQLLDDRGGHIEKELHGLRDSSLAALAAVGLHTKSIQTMAHDVLTFCEPDAGSSAQFDQAANSLQTTGELLLNLTSGLDVSSSQTESGDWKRRYTMESERQIHAAVLGHTTTAPTSMTEHAAENTELFGVDLFTEQESPHSTPALPSDTPTPTITTEAAETSAAPADRKDNGLGSNVDLF